MGVFKKKKKKPTLPTLFHLVLPVLQDAAGHLRVLVHFVIPPLDFQPLKNQDFVFAQHTVEVQ